jgi:hypothetical protein
LWKFAICALLVGVLIGGVLSQIEPSDANLFGERVLGHAGLARIEDDTKLPPALETPPGMLEAFAEEVTDSSVHFVDVIWAVPSLAPYVAAADHPRLRENLTARFSGEEADLAIDYLAAWNLSDRAAFSRLQSRAAQSEQRFVRYVLGQIEMRRENYRAAFALFRSEGERAEAGESRFMAVEALVQAKDFAALSTLREDPRYQRYFTPHVALETAIQTRDWLGILATIPVIQITSYENTVIIVTLVAGLAWGIFLLHLGEVSSLFSRSGALCALGFIAGVISTTPTIFLVILEDDILGFSVGTDVLRSFAYYIAGVAAREELCKLLLFLPLLPFLIKRDDELEALTVAAFVGLGFAIEENGTYFMMSEAASAPGRFLTANFFHVALTGLNGLALFRACTRGVGGLNDLMLVLPLTITAHGVYDALLDVPDIDGGGFLAMIVYVGFSLYFFHRIDALRRNVRLTLSLTGSFVFGISILGATVIAFQMATLGAAAGATLIFSELISSAVLLLMFFRQFNEPMTG